MRFIETPLRGAFVIELEPIEDERGYFARAWCADEFATHGLNPDLTQCNVVFNHKRGTLRGMHYQCAPHEEAKLIRCTAGVVHDVIVDIRPASATYGQSFAVELSPRNGRMMYVPEGFAHGVISLTDDSEMFYQLSVPYVAASQRGIRYDDPALAIDWPIEPAVISPRDLSFAPFALVESR